MTLEDLVSYSGWDEEEVMSIIFYNVVLKKAINKVIPAGTKFEVATFSIQKGQVTFTNYGPEELNENWEPVEEHVFELDIKIGAKIR